MKSKHFIRIAVFFSIFSLTVSGCGKEEKSNKIDISTSAKEFKKENYKKVEDQLRKAGFENIEIKKKDDLVAGWLNKDGDIEKVSIDGNTDFDAGDSFDKGSKVVITYHTFKKEAVSSNTTESSITQEEVLNEQNNSELAHILKTSDDYEAYRDFVINHKNQTIEFDGNIASVINHENYKTRYDILINSGDYSTTTAIGAAFQFKNISPATIEFTGDNKPESLKEGQNIHIVAKVIDYSSDLIIIEPITINMR